MHFLQRNAIDSNRSETETRYQTMVDNSPLCFHDVRSINIHISTDRLIVKRYTPGWGFCFSNRSLRVNECLALKVLLFHKGTLKFGLTTHNPDTLKHGGFCLDEENDTKSLEENGYWVKELSKKAMKQHNSVFFMLTEKGELIYGVNNKYKGSFFSGIPTNVPVWAYFNIIGKMLAIKMIDMECPPLIQKDSSKKILRTRSFETVSKSEMILPTSNDSSINNQQDLSRDVQLKELKSRHSMQRKDKRMEKRPSLIQNGSTSVEQESIVSPDISNQVPLFNEAHSSIRNVPRSRSARVFNQSNMSRTSQNTGFSSSRFNGEEKQIKCPMTFHCNVGRNICLSSDRITAVRHIDSRNNGYVFTERPLKLNEKLKISINIILEDIPRMLTFGLTVCDPMDTGDLPDDADALMDRPEYWVVRKDFVKDIYEGVELTFVINNEGEVHLYKDNDFVEILMHIDVSLPLWPFFDISDAVQKITSLGVILSKRSRRAEAERLSQYQTDSQNNYRQIERLSSQPNVITDNNENSTSNAQRNSSSMLRQHSREISLRTSKTSKGNHRAQLMPNDDETATASFSDLNIRSCSSNGIYTNTIPSSSSSSISSSNVQQIDLLSDVPILSTLPLIPVPAAQIIHRSATNEQASSFVTDLVSVLEEESGKNSENMSSHNSQPKLEDLSNLSECIICFEGMPDCALYTCGHMCLCFTCAQRLMKKQSPLCPVCRKPIMDILRIFKP